MLAQPRPEPQRRVKARSKREAAKIVRQVRAACVERDGRCRYANDVHAAVLTLPAGAVCITYCEGESEWAHLNEFARYKTRGQPPAARHHTHGTAIICKRHHAMLHDKKLTVSFLSDLGADGPLAWERT
jgi:hypothetical protein